VHAAGKRGLEYYVHRLWVIGPGDVGYDVKRRDNGLVSGSGGLPGRWLRYPARCDVRAVSGQ
jgi:hypothetical protein